jgi:protein-tyrosine phosphatase
MTDLHSHILPCIDDGSSSVEESVKLLQILASQGVDTVCATPHFYPSRDNPQAFFERRKESYEKLSEALVGTEHPNILLGAEVAYFPGISRLKELYDLRLEDSKILLLEMTMNEWSEYELRELTEIACMGSISLVVAHAERYRKYQKDEAWYRLLDLGVLFQSNASYFANIRTRRKAVRQLKRNEIHFIGSDCHNLDDRAPKIAQANAVITEKLDATYLTQMQRLFDSFVIKK